MQPGTNFCIRVRSLAHAGWFPEYTITEDYALGMELKSRGYKVRRAAVRPVLWVASQVRGTICSAPQCPFICVTVPFQMCPTAPAPIQATYLMEYLAMGEAPDEIRNVSVAQHKSHPLSIPQSVMHVVSVFWLFFLT